MKKAVGTIFGRNRRNFVLLGMVLSLVAFGLVVFRADAQSKEVAACPATADYQLQNTMASSVGGAPGLTNIGAGNAFANDTVDTVSRTVLQFPAGNGVQLQPTTGTIANDAYTVVVLFKFSSVSGFRKILDFKNGSSDGGLYVLNGFLNFYPLVTGTTTPIAPDTYVQVVLTRASDGTIIGYVDGVQQFSVNDGGGALIDANNALRFFKDDNTTGGENSAGAAARIRLFNCVLTPAEVTGLDRLATACNAAPVTFNYTGAMQTYTVPAGVTSITVTASGAEGGIDGSSTFGPGLGADITGTITVTPGQVLKVLVGGRGIRNGGGGGSFVTDNSNNPLVIAGGGGGSADGNNPNKQGQAGTAGGNGVPNGGTGGTGGNGGNAGASYSSGGGGGLLTDGATGSTAGSNGRSFVSGGAQASNGFGIGGFGGGGGGSGYVVGGGGGGYSGGGSGSNSGTLAGGGGGGSFNAGTNQTNTAGSHAGEGVIVITPGCPTQQQADLAITKTDGITNFTAPGQTTYTIVVTNSGPNPAVDALVTDNFPAGVTVDNWTCLPQNQAFCRLAGAGNINELVYIPVGGILTYTATATVAANQTGQLVNTATVTAPPTLTDPNQANNSATDTDNFVVSISGNAKQFVSGGPNTNLAGVTMTLSGTNSGTATTGADGNYTFTNLTSGGTWTITPSMSGKVFDPVSRTVTGATANVTGVNFIAYNTSGIPRNIFVVNTHAIPGNPVTVPIRITAQGTERSGSFSLDYPIGVLNTPTVACGASVPACTIAANTATLGKIGVTITGASDLAAGLREIATVTFQTNVGFAPPNAAVDFSATPTAQSVRDAAGNELQKTFTNGFVVFVDGVESDVAGRNTGNGDVLSTDVTQVRRFVVGTDTVNLSFNEFQRADSAPIFTRGDGELLPGDVIQARRYSARLDNLQAAGGPGGPPPPPLGPIVAPIEEIAETSRVIRTERVTADPGQQVTVGVDIEPQGDEVAAAFTLEYNAARLGNARVTLADDAPEGAVLTVNSDDAASGRIGILIDADQPFARDSSARRLVNVTFDVAANSAGGEARIRFTDATAKRGVSDGLGNTLDARYTDGAVMISGPEARGFELTGRVTTPDGRGLRGAQVTITDENGVARTVTTSAFGFYRFEDLAAGENYMVSVTSRRHRFAARTITLNDNLTDVDFAAQE